MFRPLARRAVVVLQRRCAAAAAGKAPAGGADRVIIVSDEAAYDKIISSGDKAISYFTASWCGPCRAIKPVFSALSAEAKNVRFLKIDVDDNQELAVKNRVRAVPTFIVHDKGQKLEEFTGADEFALRSAVSKLTGAGTSAPE